MKSKTLITPEFMMQDNVNKAVPVIGVIFILAGLGLVSIPILSRELEACILLPFACIFLGPGVMFIARTHKLQRAIATGNVYLYIDVVGDKETRASNDMRGEGSQWSHWARLRKLKKWVPVASRHYKVLGKGSNCLVCFRQGEKNPFAVYSCAKFEMDEAVQNKTAELPPPWLITEEEDLDEE